MGAWNASINGNDTAQDLKSEYQAAFFYNDVETALAKIDAYVRQEGFDESDEEEWCNYYYSLVDFMWKHGILTDEVRTRAVEMIDTSFGLDIWAEEGTATLNKRKKVLAEFREKLLSPQPPKKKITIKKYLKPVFETGDLVAIQLQTTDKHHIPKSNFSEQFFRECDGKYVVLRKVKDEIGYESKIEPAVKDHWAVFQLYGKVFDSIPTADELKDVPWADPLKNQRNRPWFKQSIPINGLFWCESSMFYFKKRKFLVIGKDISNIPVVSEYFSDTPSLFLGINHTTKNTDTDILNAILD